MDINQLYETLKKEYISGEFFIKDNKIGWFYKSEGVDCPEEAEDRWLSFLGAKITVQTVIEDTNFMIIQKFEINNRIGFFIKEDENKRKAEKVSNKQGYLSGIFK